MMIDIIFALLMIFAIVKGIQRGLIIALFSFLGLIVGLAAAIKLSALVAGHLEEQLSVSSPWLPIFTFIVIFVLVALLVRWIANLLTKIIDLALMGWLNKLAGVALYAVIYTAIYSILLFYGTHSHIISAHAREASVVYPWIEPWGPSIIDGLGKIIPIFRDMFKQLESFFEKASKQAV
jgi:membrane protein required for colicin V production